jgi:hypothetical protein
MIKRMKMIGLLVLGLNLVACSKGTQPRSAADTPAPAISPAPATPAPAEDIPAVATTPTGGKAVKTEMRNVLFHLTDQAAARIETLTGELLATGKNDMPVFDDKTSFEVRVVSGKISITPEALASIMNSYVFARSDAPLKDLSISINKNRLIIKGKMHSKSDIPFQTEGTVSATPDGRLRVHTEKVKALHVPVKGMMGVLGIELADVVNTSKIDGLDTDKNDLLMDLGKLLPPPHIRGKVTRVSVENNTIVTVFGDGGASAPAQKEKGNYMSFEGGSVRFGKLVMERADLSVLDLDPADPLDWNQGRYKDQLVAGYSKITPNFGLRAYVKDFAKLPRSSAAAAAIVPPALKN